MIILGIDPGGATGWATIILEGKFIKPGLTGVITNFETDDTIDTIIASCDVVVIENFRVRPGHARGGSFDWKTMDTSEIIGAIKRIARKLEKQVVLQEPAIKPAGYGFSGMKYRAGKKGTHWQDALAHAVYYAVTRQNALPVEVTK